MFDNVLYYVHHEGNGHVSRAAAICRHIEYPVTILTSADVGDSFKGLEHVHVVPLQMDTDAPYTESEPNPDLPECLHYAPVAVNGLRNRMTQIATQVNAKTPNVFVVDVSVEVTLFARLMGLPVVVKRMNGTRNDLPHQVSFQSSVSLIANWFEPYEQIDTPGWVAAKTFYAGGVSRYDGRDLQSIEKPDEIDSERKTVCVLSGQSAQFASIEEIAVTAQEVSDWDWIVVGNYEDASGFIPDNVTLTGWVDDTLPYILHSDVIASAAGDNTIMEVGFARKPLITFPEYRSFNEQRMKGYMLEEHKLAQVFAEWSNVDDWNAVLNEALESEPDWESYIDGQGSRRAAEHINRLVKEYGWKR